LVAVVLLVLIVAGVWGAARVRHERDEARNLARFFLRELAPTLNETPGAVELGERLSVDALDAFSRDLDLVNGPVDERLMLAHAWNDQGTLASSDGQAERAAAAQAMASTVVAPLVAQHPRDPAVRLEAARLKLLGVDILLDASKEDEAMAQNDELLAEVERLAAERPDDPEVLRVQRRALNRSGVVRANRGEVERAVEIYRKQVAIADHWNRVAPGEVSGSVLISSMADLAMIESSLSLVDARRDLERAVADGRRLLSGRESVEVREALGEALLQLGRLQLGVDDVAARAALTEAVGSFMQKLRLKPEDPLALASLIDASVLLGDSTRAWAEAQRVDQREEFGDAFVAAAFLAGKDDRVLALRGEGDDPLHASARAMSAVILSLRGDAAGALAELDGCLEKRCYELALWNGATVRARSLASGANGGPVLRLAQALPGSMATRVVRDAAWRAFAEELRRPVKK
jgi:tetratricopeptide (TPR) repeat protein